MFPRCMFKCTSVCIAVCDSGKWGEECNKTCACVSANTSNCSSEKGHCSCSSGWSGSTCTDDVNECLNGDAICPPNSECLNLNGTFFCKCYAGFSKTGSGDCIGMYIFGVVDQLYTGFEFGLVT